MNTFVRSKLSIEYQVLYDLSRQRKMDRHLIGLLRAKIRDFRLLAQAEMKGDALAMKERNFGNKGQWALKKARELERMLYENKTPAETHLGEWLSAEIELIMPSESAEKKFVKFVRSEGYSKFVTIKNDGSIDTSDEGGCDCDDEDECECGSPFGREIVITFRYGNWDFVKAICKKLHQVGCTINKSCGLHVHFDSRHMSARQVTTVGKRLAAAVPMLKLLLPKSRANNQYCATTINSHRGGERYAFVNLQSYRKYKTLEVRGHSGTTDGTKIVNWIRILRKIMDTKNSGAVSTLSEFVNAYKFDNDLSDYVVARYRKFNKNDSGGVDDVAEDNETRAA